MSRRTAWVLAACTVGCGARPASAPLFARSSTTEVEARDLIANEPAVQVGGGQRPASAVTTAPVIELLARSSCPGRTVGAYTGCRPPRGATALVEEAWRPNDPRRPGLLAKLAAASTP